jgi:N-acetylmuramic acid 6-phosphate etherase
VSRAERRPNAPLFLGIEGGATRTVALLADARGREVARFEAGPGNVRLLNDAQLGRLLRELRARLPRPAALALGMAGAATEQDRQRIRAAAARVWPRTPCHATHDLETALAAAAATASSLSTPPLASSLKSEIRNPKSEVPRVLVLCGTGSICYGQTPTGETAKLGGWGHLLGDKGSGYEIGLRALKAVVYYYDRDGAWSNLGQRLLRVLQLNEPTDLIGWTQEASKRDTAALAVEVFAACQQRDKIAADILEGAAQSLAQDAVACARRLCRDPGRDAFHRVPTVSTALAATDEPDLARDRSSPKDLAATADPDLIEFILAGGVFLNQPRFAARVGRLIKQHWPAARVRSLEREGAWGAVLLAKRIYANAAASRSEQKSAARRGHSLAGLARGAEAGQNDRALTPPPLADLHASPTEQRHPRSARLDRLPLGQAIELMLSEEAKIPRALRAERRQIERAIRLIVRAFRRGGRLFYVGAGTSGRLGVLDASECPPTFSVPPDLVQGIIAGGQHALWRSVEGAEDNADAGARAVAFRGVRAGDVVVGIAASGRTPFVWGALDAAKARGAATLLLCFNPRLRPARGARPDLIIAPNVGPEVLTGSTRLKAGTATKVVLNLLTTLAMVRLGKVVSNLMVAVNPANTKLRDRAVRIVVELTGAEEAVARKALAKAGWVVKKALKRLGKASGRL